MTETAPPGEPPDPLDALLLEHLGSSRADEAAPGCPRCGYVLRGLRHPVCPECGDRLRLELGSPDVRDTAWLWAMAGFLCSSGLYVVLVVAWISWRMRGVSAPDIRQILVFAPPFVIAAGVTALLRRPLRRLRHRGVLGGLLFVVGIGGGFATMLMLE